MYTVTRKKYKNVLTLHMYEIRVSGCDVSKEVLMRPYTQFTDVISRIIKQNSLH